MDAILNGSLQGFHFLNPESTLCTKLVSSFLFITSFFFRKKKKWTQRSFSAVHLSAYFHLCTRPSVIHCHLLFYCDSLLFWLLKTLLQKLQLLPRCAVHGFTHTSSLYNINLRLPLDSLILAFYSIITPILIWPSCF